MDVTEHAAARACGLAIERGMYVHARGPTDDGILVDGVVIDAREDGTITVRCWYFGAEYAAPDLTDPATYRAGLAQWLRRAVDAAKCGETATHAEDTAGALLLTPDPARLAALLRETAAKEG